MKQFTFRDDNAVARLRELYADRGKLLGLLRANYELSLPVLSSIIEVKHQLEIESLEKDLKEIDMQIANLIRYEHLSHLKPFLERFHNVHTDPNKVAFVMMKFPLTGKARTRNDDVLATIYRTIKDLCQELYGLHAVCANEFNAADNIWDNAQVHMLGCGYGIAVLENKHSNEFNPNVAMEAGYMAGIGRPVMLLVEDEFPYNRADIQGRIKHSFRWGDEKEDVDSIRKSLADWFDSIPVKRRPGSAIV